MAKYVEILFRYRLRFVVLIFVLPAALASACIVLFPHQMATSALWVDTPAYISISPSVQGWNQYLTPAQNTVDALDQLMGTDLFTNKMGATLDAANSFRDAGERQSILATLSKDVLAVPNGSHLVVLSYSCPRQPLCTDVLSATEQVYRQWLMDEQTAQAKVAIDFYTGQLSDAQAKLASDQDQLNKYLAAHPNLRPSEVTTDSQFDLLSRTVANDLLQVAGLQQKIDDVRLTNAAVGQTDETVLKVVDPPRAVGGKLNTLPRKQMLIAGGIGLAIAFGVLLFLAWSDRTVREARELENRFHVPVVTTISDIRQTASNIG